MINISNIVVKAENYETVRKINDGRLYWREGPIAFCYVERQKNTYHYITEKDLKLLSMDEKQLNMKAIFNTNRSQQISAGRMDKEKLVVWEGNTFEISQVLMNIDTTLENCIAAGLPDTGYVMVMPITDRLLMMAFDLNGNDTGYLAFMKSMQEKSKDKGNIIFDYPIKYKKAPSFLPISYMIDELELGDEAESYYKIAMQLYDAGKLEDAAKLLENILVLPQKMDNKFLSAVHTTLGAIYSNYSLTGKSLKGKDLRNEIIAKSKKAEAYLEQALELNPQNSVAPRQLAIEYAAQNELLKMCETIAKYNIDIRENKSRKKFLEKNQIEDQIVSNMLNNMIHEAIVKCVIEEPDKFEDFYEIHERYVSSDKYTYLLINCALISGNNYRLSVLYQDLIRNIKRESISELEYFTILINRLYGLTHVAGEKELEKALAEVEEQYVKCKDQLNDTTRHTYYSNKIVALAHLGRGKEAIQLFSNIESKYYDNTVLYNAAQAYLKNEEYDDALRLGESASLYKEDEHDLVLIGKAYMGLKKYDKAIEPLKKAIRYIYAEKEESYEFGDYEVESFSICGAKDKKLMLAYPSLIQAYVGNGEYEKAKATFLEMKDMVRESEINIDVSLILSIEENLVGKEKAVQEEYQKIKRELEKSNQEISLLKKNAQEWYTKLLECQYGDKNVKIDDDMWESEISEKMQDVIKIITSLCMKPKSKDYRKIVHDVEYRFPKLKGQAKDFFVTAEQIYHTFEKEEMIDFAPVVVEYCRAIETLLWTYFDQSENYREYAEAAKEYRNQGATMGAAIHTVSKIGKPLSDYHKKLKELKDSRNDCAHVNVSKEPDVKELRDYLWKHELIDVLCNFD